MIAVEKMKEKYPMLFWTIYKSFSVESSVMIKRHALYLPHCDLNKDPNVLAQIINETHFAKISGELQLMKHYERELKEIEFNSLVQKPDEKLSDFYKKYLEYRKTLVSCKVKTPKDEREAMKFLLKLDPIRYGRMLSQMKNAALTGTAYPATLPTAYDVAGKWTVEFKPKLALQSSFVLADDRGGRGGGGGGRGRVGHGGGRFPGRGRGRLGRGGGQHKDAEKKDEQAQKSDKSKKEHDMSGWVIPAGCDPDPRTCRGCMKRGHIWLNCPDNTDRDDNKETVMVATEEDDCQWEDDDDPNFNYMITRSVKKNKPNCVNKKQSVEKQLVLFATDEILLDNQAAQSIFHNERLLHGVQGRTPYHLGSIDKSHAGLNITRTGGITAFSKLGLTVGLAAGASANVLSQARVIDAGYSVKYDRPGDLYVVQTDDGIMEFRRRKRERGGKSPHYTYIPNDHGLDDLVEEEENAVYVETVAENMKRFTTREVKAAKEAKDLMVKLGHASFQSTIDVVNRGIMNNQVTAVALRNARKIFGLPTASLKGKTNHRIPAISTVDLAARVTQVQQNLSVDIFFVYKMPFLLGLLSPLGLTLVEDLNGDRSVDAVGPAIRTFISKAASRNFDVKVIQTDGEKAVAAMKNELQDKYHLELEGVSAGTHVPDIERKVQTVKKRVRAHHHDLPFIMGRVLLSKCVFFCVSRINMVAVASSVDKVSPMEQFTGRKLDAKLDLRVNFGDYLQATNPYKTNQVGPAATEGGIAAIPSGNLRGSVKIWRLSTETFVDRDDFQVLPMTDDVIAYLNAMAATDGITRLSDPFEGEELSHADEDDHLITAVAEPTMQAIQRIDETIIPDEASLPTQGVDEVLAEDVEEEAEKIVSGEIDLQYNEMNAGVQIPQPTNDWVRRSVRVVRQLGLMINTTEKEPSTACREYHKNVKTVITKGDIKSAREQARRQFHLRKDWYDKEYAFHMSVKAAMRDRPVEARAVIEAEILQMVDKGVWHGVHTRNMSKQERKAIIRSSMFLKDKYSATGEFEKFKARLVAGGDQQDKELYDDLCAPTAVTDKVFAMVAASLLLLTSRVHISMRQCLRQELRFTCDWTRL